MRLVPFMLAVVGIFSMLLLTALVAQWGELAFLLLTVVSMATGYALEQLLAPTY